jgi:hypothetical protein
VQQVYYIETYVSEHNVGDFIGNVLNTDIRVFIDDVQIMGYNIDGWTYVVAEDLFAYGFWVDWDGVARTLSVTRYTSTAAPKPVPTNLEPVGSIAFPYLYTDIVTYIDGKSVASYNINGQTVVRVDDVADAFGEAVWDDEQRVLTVTLINTQEQQSEKSFVRDDGVIFEVQDGFLTIWLPGVMSTVIFTAEGNDLPANDWMQSLGFRPMEGYVWAWASGGLTLTQTFPEGDYRLVPYWYYYEHYRNPNPWPVCLFDNTWARDAETFITNQVRPVTRNVGSWSHFSQQLSNNTANRVQTSYANDTIRNVMPFNAAFWNRITGRPEYHFWLHEEGARYAGLYGWGRVGTGISPNTFNGVWHDMGHVGTLAHEIAHHFGFNEHLAHFFDQVFVSERMTPFGGGTHYRSTTMDWIMMEQVGQVEFMRAIFWGNDYYYRQIWDKHIEPILGITFENMQLARSATQYAWHLWSTASEADRQSLERIIGTNEWGRPDHERMSHEFENAFNQNLTQARRNQYAQAARTTVNNMANWASQRDLRPYDAIFTHADGITTGIPMRRVYESEQITHTQQPITNFNIATTTNNPSFGTSTSSRTTAGQGNTVNITANTNPGNVFERWEVLSGNVTINNPTSASTSFAMQSSHVLVRAVFRHVQLRFHQINVAANNHTAGWASATHSARMGDVVHLNAQAFHNHTFARWEVISGNVVISNPTFAFASFVMPDGPVSIRAIFEATPTLSVNVSNNNPQWGFVTASPAAGLREHSWVSLSAVANPGFEFSRWEVVSGNVTLPYQQGPWVTFTMPASDVHIRAVFTESQNRTVTVTVNDSRAGTATASPNIHVLPNQQVFLWAHANHGFRFSHWEVLLGNANISNATSVNTSFIMPEGAVSIRAVFNQVQQGNMVLLITNIQEGTTNTSHTNDVPQGQRVTLTAQPHTGFDFVRWDVIQGNAVIDNPASANTSFIMPNERVEIRSIFRQHQAHAITFLVNDSRMGSASSSPAFVRPQQIAMITAVPNTGFVFSHWEVVSGGGVVNNPSLQYTRFTMPTNDVTLRAVFRESGEFSVSVDTSNIFHGTANASATSSLRQNDRVTLTAQPTPGHELSRWEVISGNAVIDNPNSLQTSFLMPAGNVSVRAVFQPLGVTISQNYAEAGNARITNDRIYTETVPIERHVTVSTNVNTGFEFSHWEVVSGNVALITPTSQSTRFIVLNAPVHIRAVYRRLQNINITVTVNNPQGGTAWANDTTLLEGRTTVVQSRSNAGFSFSHWEIISGDVASSVNLTNSGMPLLAGATDIHLMAVFNEIVPPTPVAFRLTVEGQNGIVEIETPVLSGNIFFGSTSVNAGAMVMLYPVPNEGFRFSHWEAVPSNITFNNNPGITDGTDVNFRMPSSDALIRAIFVPQ